MIYPDWQDSSTNCEAAGLRARHGPRVGIATRALGVRLHEACIENALKRTAQDVDFAVGALVVGKFDERIVFNVGEQRVRAYGVLLPPYFACEGALEVSYLLACLLRWMMLRVGRN